MALVAAVAVLVQLLGMDLRLLLLEETVEREQRLPFLVHLLPMLAGVVAVLITEQLE